MHIKNEVVCPISELEELIPSKFITSVNIRDISRIFQYEDPFLQYFLLTRNTDKSFPIDKKSTHKVIKMIENIRKFTIVKYNKIILNASIISWLKSNAGNFKDPSDIISILQVCQLSEKDKTFFRKFFGYNLIYKEYKRLITEESTKNLDIILILLDNNKICNNRLLEIYKKLNFYLENNILDKNFVFCCKVLYSLLNYEFQDSYQDFLL